ncbi:MAG: tetratricopeptide repeat protein [Gammaproteobacteria bacterium]|nr:tetratricopeptide repeat protein [Gammaproteobacteria bacterium]MCI0590569.1 tetratricopeptide repeat protein [Gammaproteobacteria bacterium]
MTFIDNLEAMLARGQDSAVLRLSLGNAYLKQGDDKVAIAHLRQAVTLSPKYSAAWKILGKALSRAGQVDDALAAYKAGIEVAEQQGDIQAAKEMKVFARRLTNQAK